MILYNGKPAGLGQQAWYAPYPYIAPQQSTVAMSPPAGPSGPPPGPGEPGGPPLTQAGLEAQLREGSVPSGTPAGGGGGGSAGAGAGAGAPSEGFPVVPAVLVGVAALAAAIMA